MLNGPKQTEECYRNPAFVIDNDEYIIKVSCPDSGNIIDSLNHEVTENSYINPAYVADKDEGITEEIFQDSVNITDINVNQATAGGKSNTVAVKDDTRRGRLRHVFSDKIFRAKVLKIIIISHTLDFYNVCR